MRGYIPQFGFGMQIYESGYLTKPEECEVKRSWRERFLSFPWRPWKSTKVIIVQVPDPHCYVFGDMILCHPDTARQLRERWVKND